MSCNGCGTRTGKGGGERADADELRACRTEPELVHDRWEEEREAIERRAVHEQRDEEQKHVRRRERAEDFGDAELVNGVCGRAVEDEATADDAVRENAIGTVRDTARARNGAILLFLCLR